MSEQLSHRLSCVSQAMDRVVDGCEVLSLLYPSIDPTLSPQPATANEAVAVVDHHAVPCQPAGGAHKRSRMAPCIQGNLRTIKVPPAAASWLVRPHRGILPRESLLPWRFSALLVRRSIHRTLGVCHHPGLDWRQSPLRDSRSSKYQGPSESTISEL
ncbi:hypothetical protein L226DRAFT_219083 [Lentinus tigrinus ALCF2SS1-7]|uniref:uncharacterized protein n=1 Tax=Lentinus tigrinus ALCF2SS1-7 TaxID=1328758 RepID=UPI0011661F1B|nr:hypothetical protein L226DRAFT_219083 [Lentinus tigrinus ALCF2SS1-7]